MVSYLKDESNKKIFTTIKYNNMGEHKMEEIEHARELVEEILELVDEVPEEGESFGQSVAEKAIDILAWVDEHDTVTDNQLAALENMRDGLARWVNH